MGGRETLGRPWGKLGPTLDRNVDQFALNQARIEAKLGLGKRRSIPVGSQVVVEEAESSRINSEGLEANSEGLRANSEDKDADSEGLWAELEEIARPAREHPVWNRQ